MRRSMDDALQALRAHVRACALGRVRAEARVLVYAPEWEAALGARLGAAARSWAADGWTAELVDVGQRFRAELERRPHRLQQLLDDDASSEPMLAASLGEIASGLVREILLSPLEPPAGCRILSNTAAVATFTSFSAVTNALYDSVPASAVLLFPGEADDRTINVLGLRADPSYRIPRL